MRPPSVQDTSGAAYLDRNDPDTAEWSFHSRVSANDATGDDYFGHALAFSNSELYAGALGADAVYAFTTDGDSWTQRAEYRPDTPRRFGYAVASKARVLAVGDDFSDTAGRDTGSVLLFDLGECRIDVNRDSLTDIRDVLVFLSAWVSGKTIADWNSDGTINTLDFLAFLNDWVAGC